MGAGDYSPGSVWYYAPNKAAPILFIILYSISGILHVWQTIKHKSWRATAVLPWASLLMIAGFVMRLLGAYNTSNLGYMIASTVLVLAAPPVYAVVNYLILSRLLYYIPYLSPLHPGRVATTFIGLDAVCEVLIGQGAWRMADSSSSDAQRRLGARLVSASLCLQAALFGAFGVLALLFHRRAKAAGVLKPQLRTVLYVLYVSAVIVTMRCIYRLVEYFSGWDSEIYKNETYFWIFDVVILWINSVILNIWHPGSRLPSSNTVFLAKDGVTERKGLGWGDDRPWILTIFDPFDVWGFIMGRDKKTQFWDLNDDELEALRLEKKRNKRNFCMAFLDPFHLWGRTGYVAKWTGRSPNGGGAASEVHTTQTKSGDAKSYV